MNVMCIIVWYTAPPQTRRSNDQGRTASVISQCLALIITNVSMTPLWSDLWDPVMVVVSICIAYSTVTDNSLVLVLGVTWLMALCGCLTPTGVREDIVIIVLVSEKDQISGEVFEDEILVWLVVAIVQSSARTVLPMMAGRVRLVFWL